MDMALTAQSQAQFDHILYGDMTPKMVAEYLRSERVVARDFGETMRIMYPHEDLQERLVAFFTSSDESLNRRSVTRKIQNWLNGRNKPSSRDDIYKIAFALQLSEDQLNTLLGIVTGYCIQYRDGKELVLSWFLRNGFGYSEALEFYSSLPEYAPHNSLSPSVGDHVTHDLQAEHSSIHALEELQAFYLSNMDHFGDHHLRAYFYFNRYLNQLIQPTSYIEEDEPSYTLDTVMNTYLALHMPPGKQRSGMTLVQRLLKNNWPNITTLKNVIAHNEDVPRKLLLLLYVVTENCGFSDDDYGLEGADSLEDRVSDHWWTINAMLQDCGMARLDLRSAFDWLIMYATTADPDEVMSERLEQVISSLYEA